MAHKFILTTVFIVTLLFVAFSAATANAELNDGLIAYYTFNGNANDESGNGHNGTAYGGSTLTSDRFGNPDSAYSFDSVDDYINLGPENQLFPSSNFSVTIWVKIPPVSTSFMNIGIIGDYTYSTTPFWYLTLVDNGLPTWGSGKADFGLRSNEPESERALLSVFRVDDDNWHHLVIVRDAGAEKMYLYIDGALDGLSDATSGSIWSGQNITIARHIPDAGRYSIFTGDDIRIYNRVLSTSEVQNLYLSESSVKDAVLQKLQNVLTITNAAPTVSFNNLNNKTALANKINKILNNINSGNYADALDQLQNDILQKTNGCYTTEEPDKNDWITVKNKNSTPSDIQQACETQFQVYSLIIKAINYLETLL